MKLGWNTSTQLEGVLMMRRGPKPIFFFPPAAFLLTILSFTSIKPASVFALYVATVSRALPWAVHRDVYPCWWCKWRGCGGPNGAAQSGAGRGNWERGRSDAPPGQGELHGCCHPPWCHWDGHKTKALARWWPPKAQLSFLGTSATQGSAVAMGLPLVSPCFAGRCLGPQLLLGALVHVASP